MGDDFKTDEQKRLIALAAIGEVSAGVTHEVRNAMTGILGFAQVALKRLETRPESTAELLVLIEQETQRCVQLLTQFLSVSRPHDYVRALVDLHGIVVGASALMAQQLDMSAVKLELDLARDVPCVFADSSAIKQVMLNLLINAMQSAGEGGLIVVTLRTTPRGDAQVKVSDNGPGVPGPIAERIFEKFFTTKRDGAGTGLGLAVSRDIVEEHGGTLTLEPASGHGAVFALSLPGRKKCA